MRKLVETIGPTRMTFYGDIMEMTNKSLEEMEHKDTAWSNTALPAHNDGTYFYDSPGYANSLHFCKKEMQLTIKSIFRSFL